MQLSNLPTRIQVPFAVSGSKRTIPVASQIGVTPGAASFTDGFPPLTFTPLAGGGIPPAGQDFNGVLNAITAIQQWQAAGGSFTYNSAWSTANNGYPQGAVILRADGTGYWFNTTDNNTADPDGATPTGWVPEWQYGITAVSGLTNANVTLTSLQYGRSIITLAGALTGNVQIILPALLDQWLIANNTSGAFTVTVKTAAGTGQIVPQGRSLNVWGDGTNINAQGSFYPGPQLAVLTAASGNFTVPPGVYILDVETWGGGGGGGGVGSTANGSAGGGGGGGYARSVMAVTPGQVIAYTVGAAGGAGGAGAAGGGGGTTGFGGVVGGNGGGGGSANTGTTGGAGGNGSGGLFQCTGSGGGGGLGAGTGLGAGGGGAPFGGPGCPGSTGQAGPGAVPGGGGGGSGSSAVSSGGAGGRGQINVKY